MASCYGGGTPGEGTRGLDALPYLNIQATLRTGRRVEVCMSLLSLLPLLLPQLFLLRNKSNASSYLSSQIGPFKTSEYEQGRQLLNIILQEGLSWPFVELQDMAQFQAYFLSHAAFVVRACEDGVDADGKASYAGRTPVTLQKIHNNEQVMSGQRNRAIEAGNPYELVRICYTIVVLRTSI